MVTTTDRDRPAECAAETVLVAGTDSTAAADRSSVADQSSAQTGVSRRPTPDSSASTLAGGG